MQPVIEAIAKHATLLPNKAVVQMHPEPEQTDSGIFLNQKSYKPWHDAQMKRLRRATLLTGIAPTWDEKERKGSHESLSASDIVLMNQADGKRIKDFKIGGEVADGEIRLLGIVCRKWGDPLRMPLGETMMAVIDPTFEKQEGAKTWRKGDPLPFRALYFNAVLMLPEREERTASGLFLPDVIQERPQDTAIVVSLGPDAHPSIKVGDRVLYERRALFNLELEGWENLAMIDASESGGIYLVIDEEEQVAA